MRDLDPSSRSRWFQALCGCALLTAAALLPLGCAFAPNQDHVVDGVVLVAPPPPQVEVMGSPPSADFVWISGYWSWVGNRHVWVGGHWAKPRPGHHWVAHQWVRQGDGWRLHPGHWARDN